jgi:3-(3-hydroxy-phenyl)propionate hydroxylase
MLANILGMYGRSVAVLEAGDDLIDYPRGVGLDDESLRTIQTVGLVETVLPHTTPHHIMRLVDSAGNVLLVNGRATTEFGRGRKHGFIQPEGPRSDASGPVISSVATGASPLLASDWASDSTGIRHRHDGWSSTLRGARVRLGEVCATRRPNVAIDADSADRRPMRTGSKEGISS